MTTSPDPTPVDTTPVDPSFVAPEFADAEPEAEAVPEAETSTAKPNRTSADLRQADLKVLYAAAGATEALIGAVQETVNETQRWASARLSELRFRRAELAKQAEEMRQRAEELPEDVKAVPEAAKGRVVELQEQATGTYNDLANRGQRVLHEVRTDVAKRIDPTFDRLQERIDAVRRALRGAAEEATPAPAPAPVAEEPDVIIVEETVVETPTVSGEDRPQH